MLLCVSAPLVESEPVEDCARSSSPTMKEPFAEAEDGGN